MVNRVKGNFYRVKYNSCGWPGKENAWRNSVFAAKLSL